MQDHAGFRGISIAAMFIANGYMVGSWAASIPGLADRLELSETRLAVVLLAFAIGGIGMMILTPRLLRTFAVHRFAVVMGAAFACTMLLPLGAPSFLTAVLGAFGFGIAHGGMDIAMNADSVEYEKTRTGPVLSRLHGSFSIGATVGALIGGALADAGFAPWVYCLVSGGIACLLLSPALLVWHGDHLEIHQKSPQKRGGVPRVLIALAFVAFACLVAEGGMIDWLAKLMQGFGASEFLAAAVYASFAGGMATGRFGGDILSARIGDRRLMFLGSLLAAVCIGTTLVVGTPVPGLALMFGAGLGVANVVPLTFRAAGRVGTNSASSLAFVTAFGYAGLLAGPPTIGFVAHATSLRSALFLIVAGLGAVSCVVWFVLSRALVVPRKDLCEA